jgi:hypothetical protein
LIVWNAAGKRRYNHITQKRWNCHLIPIGWSEVKISYKNVVFLIETNNFCMGHFPRFHNLVPEI